MIASSQTCSVGVATDNGRKDHQQPGMVAPFARATGEVDRARSEGRVLFRSHAR